MRFIFIGIGVLLTALSVSAWAVLTGQGPREKINGTWKEITWKYEKPEVAGLAGLTVDFDQKKEICGNLIIHEAESWIFHSNGTLTMSKKDGSTEELFWNIKGRGHVLELKHSSGKTEDYVIQEINDKQMELHFSFDLQVRGIVKMIFNKV